LTRVSPCSAVGTAITAGRPRRPRVIHPWRTCESVLSEAFHLLGRAGRPALTELLRREAVAPALDLASELEPILTLLRKYANVPMSLADACLVRTAETLADPLPLTTDDGFRR
jgi:hypothetical protein